MSVLNWTVKDAIDCFHFIFLVFVLLLLNLMFVDVLLFDFVFGETTAFFCDVIMVNGERL